MILSQILLKMLNLFLLIVCIPLTSATKEGSGEENRLTHHERVHISVGSIEGS